MGGYHRFAIWLQIVAEILKALMTSSAASLLFILIVAKNVVSVDFDSFCLPLESGSDRNEVRLTAVRPFTVGR